MKYMVTWSIAPENIEAAVKRSKEQGDAEIPGIKSLGLWFEGGTGRGFTLFETEDPIALTKSLAVWADLVDQKIVPVVDGEEFAKAISD